MFMGEYNHSIDTKGRLIMPAKFRDVLGEQFVVTKSLDRCLYVFTNEEWEGITEKLAKLPITNKNSREFVRFFLSGAGTCEVDKQGRILIPANLRQYANLDKDVVLVGVASKIEIWDKAAYEANQTEINDNMDDIVARMDELGLMV